MTIDEALKELELINHDGFVITRYTEYEALKLGIEALKWREFYRKTHPEMEWPLLPGETK